MPEGHTVHRLARQFDRDFVGRRLAVTSPQGRFAAGAARLDGRVLRRAEAVGKQLFLDFDGPRLRVHLGMYGAWDFHGRISAISSGGPAVTSLGAPRVRSAVRIAENETELAAAPDESDGDPPAPVGQVRARLLAAGRRAPGRPGAAGWSLADLRGPSACEVLDAAAAERVIAGLGPDPLHDDADDGCVRFVAAASRRRVPIARLLMDQTVISGIGNVYRAELLFRARLDPFRPGAGLGEPALIALWADWTRLLSTGVETGVMLTRDDLDGDQRAEALVDRELRHWVYRRHGLPCRICGTPIRLELLEGRKLYWCPVCQAPGGVRP